MEYQSSVRDGRLHPDATRSRRGSWLIVCMLVVKGSRTGTPHNTRVDVQLFVFIVCCDWPSFFFPPLHSLKSSPVILVCKRCACDIYILKRTLKLLFFSTRSLFDIMSAHESGVDLSFDILELDFHDFENILKEGCDENGFYTLKSKPPVSSRWVASFFQV